MTLATPVHRPGLVAGFLSVDATVAFAWIVIAMLVTIVVFFLFVAFAPHTPWFGDEFGPTGEQVGAEATDDAEGTKSVTEPQSDASATQGSGTTDSGTESG